MPASPMPNWFKNRLYIVAAAIAVVGLAGWWLWQGRSSNLLTKGVPAHPATAHAFQEVELKDGQTYDLTAGFVTGAIGGKSQTMLAYNGSIPGPVLKVTQGDKVKVVFKNQINLDSTIHAHGLRQDFKMDGMVGASQAPVKSGNTFTYDWTFPDPGIYWYHPHLREDYEQGSGLYGTIVVAPKDASYWPTSDAQQTLVLSDVLTDATTGLLRPFLSSGADHTLMGRYGNVQLLNGTSTWNTIAKAGTVQRYYIANAANARPFRFAIDGAKLKVIGSDNGRVGQERLVSALTLSPGERYVVDVLFDKAGTFDIKNIAPGAAKTLGQVTVSQSDTTSPAAQAFSTLRANADVANDIGGLSKRIATTKTLALNLSMDMGNMGGMDHGSMGGTGDMGGMDMGGTSTMTHTMPDGTTMGASGEAVDPELTGIEWVDSGMNMSGTPKWQLTDEDTGLANQAVNWTFKKGQVVRIVVNNSTNTMHPMQHPIHIHGQRFAVSSMNGVANTNPEWKDTVTIPSGQVYELLVVMDNPGDWMIHCHIAEHLENGMAINFKVEE